MKSIRFFLVLVIIAVLTLFLFVTALRGYQSSMEEANRLFDKQLLDAARLIANIHSMERDNYSDQNSSFAFQLWQHDNLLAASANAPNTLITPLLPGFDYSNFNGYRWRTVSYFDRANQRWVIAAERTDLRYTLAENVVLKSIFPLLIGLPLVGFLIWFIVGRGLKPLRVLADQLENKRADDLSPLPLDSTSLELEQIVISSNNLLGRLERSLQRESQFASDAAHELRTPISTLKIQLHNLGETLPDDDPQIKELANTTDRLKHIVEQILDLYRSSPDQYNASMTPINLDTLVQEVIADSYSAFDKKNQNLEYSGTSCTVLGDKFALTTLLQNLLSNANKYTAVGGQIKVSTKITNNRVILTIEDSGSGIPLAQRETVFERFYRLDGDRHRSGEPGCGLGLAIVQRIAESHNATTSITDSVFNSGVAFHISFSSRAASTSPTLRLST